MRCPLILGFFLACLLLVSTVYALPPDPPIYWTDDFSKPDVYVSSNIYNANWTYVQTQNFTVSVSGGILSIKYATSTSSPGQWFKIWRGISKNEKGIKLRWKVSKSSADIFRLGLSVDGTLLQYWVEFGWNVQAGKPTVNVAFTNMTGGLEYSDSLLEYSYSTWYWVELSYTSPVQLSVRVWKDGDSKNVYTFNTTDLRHEAAELWATGIYFYGHSPSGGRVTFSYVDYASFSAADDFDFVKTALDIAKAMLMLVMVTFAVSIFARGGKE